MPPRLTPKLGAPCRASRSIVVAVAILSKTQIDKLGERLKSGSPDEADLRELDEYRRSFGAGYEHVVGLVRGRLRLEPTGRPAKSTSSIVDKLRRESIRLTQIQDIAGCRIEATYAVVMRLLRLVSNLVKQDGPDGISH